MIIERKLQKIVEKYLFQAKRQIIVIYGPRQVGKTTLVKEILKKYPDRAQYFNGDYVSVREMFSHENAESLGNVVRGLKLLVIDEAQRIENIGLTLKILADEYQEVQVVATGSSSFDLSNKINEPLTGRKKEFHLHPFSLSELAPSGDIVKQKGVIEHALRFGGYPVAVMRNAEEAKKYLQEITGSYLFKDIFTFQDLRKPEILTKLLQLLALQLGQEVSYHELATQLGVNQSVVERYIFLLEQAFVVFRLPALSKNPRKEISKKQKVYFYDLGIRNAMIENHNDPDLRVDKGALWENYCIVERMKYLEYEEWYVKRYFWRTYTQKEVDYIEEKAGKFSAYEFKWSSKKGVRQDKEFLKKYSIDTIYAVSRNSFHEFLGLG